ncbi:protein TIC 22-like, chloroplastic [Raphanus sativus]|uniref:Protein TIC 22-like, chloroplastic n=1 Tax=Raphanus sativus TaxID=3726 RepID=A0A9W3BRE8_RAPSA|nr:protein TIC 22-like, chloroplastic [Raphanus sativus]
MVVLLEGDGPLATLALLKSPGKGFLCIGGDGALSLSVAAPVRRSSGPGLSDDEERLAGVPVASTNTFTQPDEDAEALFNQMKIMGSLWVMLFSKEEDAEALQICLLLLQVFQLKVNGVAFRLIPESTQVKNALKVC